MVDQRKPDPTMPKSKAAKNQGNTLWAHLADIRRAWEACGHMDIEEARALVLCGGLGFSYVEAGQLMGVHKSTMLRRFERGVGVLADYLNGTNYSIEDEEENHP